MSMLPTTPLSIQQVYACSIKLWPLVVKKIYGLTLLLFVCALLPYLFEPKLNTFDPFIWSKTVAESWGIALIYIFILLIIYAAAYARAQAGLLEQKCNVIMALTVGVKKLGLLLIAMILGSIILTAGYMLLLIPGIIMTLVLTFYSPIIIVDNLGPFTAIKRCWDLVTDHWWRTAAVIALPTLIYFALCVIVEIIGSKLWTYAHPAGGQIWLFSHISKLVLGMLYFPFATTLILVQLHDLKLRWQQNIDLEKTYQAPVYAPQS